MVTEAPYPSPAGSPILRESEDVMGIAMGVEGFPLRGPSKSQKQIFVLKALKLWFWGSPILGNLQMDPYGFSSNGIAWSKRWMWT